jgi:hypothetical protein
MVLGYSNFNMLGPLGLAQSYPGSHFVERADRTHAAEDQSHKTTDETTVPPAGCLKSRPEVAAQTTLAWLAVVQEKAVGTAHPIVVEVVNDRHLEIEGGLIDGGGKSGQDVVNLPKIKVTDFLIFTKTLGNGHIVVSVKGGPDFGGYVSA